MEEAIKKQEGLVASSSVIGSEPATVSFGSGKNPQVGNITVNLVDRFHRKQSIWQIEANLRREFSTIPGLKSADIFEFGATAMSSIKAPVDVMVTGPDPKVLAGIGTEIKQRLEKVLDDLLSGDTLFHGGPGATGRSFSSFDTIIESIRTKLFRLPASTVV